MPMNRVQFQKRLSLPEFVDRYLAEVQFRFNRSYGMRSMLGSLLRAIAATPRQPERGIRVAEVHRALGQCVDCNREMSSEGQGSGG